MWWDDTQHNHHHHHSTQTQYNSHRWPPPPPPPPQSSHMERSSPWSNVPTLNSRHWDLIRINFRLCGWETNKMPGIDVKMMSYGERVPAPDRWLHHQASWWVFNVGVILGTTVRKVWRTINLPHPPPRADNQIFKRRFAPLNTMSMSTIMGKSYRNMSSYRPDPLELWPANPPVTLDNSPESIPILC